MNKYMVEYSFQGDFMPEQDYSTTIVDAEDEKSAIMEVEFENHLCHARVTKVTPCEEIEYRVDLCEGNETKHSFSVMGLYPFHDDAKSKAIDIVHREYPEFARKYDAIVRRSQFAGNSMLVVRPKRWIKPGVNAYLVTVFYRTSAGRYSRYSCAIIAKDSNEAREMGLEKVKFMIDGEALSVLVERTAETSVLLREHPLSNI